jgi:hypothetical protein
MDSSAQNPLITVVPKKGKPLEEEKLEGTGISTSKENDAPKDKKDPGFCHAVPPPNDYTHNPHIPMPHVVLQVPHPL